MTSSILPPPSTLQRIALGEAAAVQQCLDEHGPLVWALARRLCPSSADVEDVVQEIFITLWKSADQFDPALGTESTWVTTVARRKLIDLRRRAARRGPTREVSEDLPAELVDQGEAVAVSDEAARAKKALAELRPEQQRVLELAIVHGLTYEEVATKLALPLGTVKTHARRGLMRVRELLSRGTAARAGGAT